MASRLQDVILRDTRANQPAVADVAPGTLYYVTDESVTERSNGSVWQDYSDAGSGSGDVVGPGSAVDDRIATFNGTTGKLIQDGGSTIADILAAAGGSWALLATQVAAGATNYDFIGLSAYNEIRVMLIALTLSATGQIQLRVSTDNGSTFLSTSGDYLGIDANNGTPTSKTEIPFTTSSTAAARYGEILIEGFNMTNAKFVRSMFFTTNAVGFEVIPTTTALNALRVLNTGAGNMNGGTILVFGR